MSKKNVLLIGASGFIGGAVKRNLDKRKVNVIAPSRIELELSLGTPHELVIFCAGKTFNSNLNISDYLETDAVLLAKVVHRAKPNKLVYISSTRIYNDVETSPATEDLDLKPDKHLDEFNYSKLVAERLCVNLNIPEVVIFRLSNVLGFNLSSTNFFYSILKDALTNGKIQLESDLNHFRDYVWIDDVVEVIADTINSSATGKYNLCSGTSVTNAKLIEFIQTTTNLNLEVVLNSAGNAANPRQISNKKIIEDFGFTPTDLSLYLPPIIERFASYYKNTTASKLC